MTNRSNSEFFIDPDIRQARTLPSDFYRKPEHFAHSLDRIFARTWQWVGAESEFTDGKYNIYPRTLLPGSMGEPLLVVRHENGDLKFLSNVCTHRANLLAEEPVKSRTMTCRYHGRCFHLDGTMKSMPGFSGARDFPSVSDHLKPYPKKQLGPFLFTAMKESPDLEEVFQPLESRMNWFDFSSLAMKEELSRTYTLDAHWALYCDNFLEGFHIPFVHPKLNQKLEFKSYQTEIYPYCNVQLGTASQDEACFDMPSGAEDAHKRIYAYYWWIFPNIMINIYTWGISVNVVLPIGPEKTRIDFITFLLPGKETGQVSGTALHDTELEDEEVVLSVQKGIKSRAYKHGRFSPVLEKGVHHFHTLIANFMKTAG